jgi:hypothetical protein
MIVEADVTISGLEVRAVVASIIAYPRNGGEIWRGYSKLCQGACPR